MKALQSPNHTQVPNDLFDVHMADMKETELKVVMAIVRLTIGYHRKKVRASISRIMGLTGLSRQGVLTGAELGEKRGLIRRDHDGGVTVWEINYEETVDVPDEGSLNFRPAPVKDLDQSGQEFRPPSIKENSKENKRKKEGNTPDGAPPRTPTVQQQMVEVLAALTGMDYHIRSNASRLGKTASELVNSGYKPENVKAFAQYWRNDDWRGRKGDKPKLSQVTELIGVVRGGGLQDLKPDPIDLDGLRRAVREAKPADDGMEY